VLARLVLLLNYVNANEACDLARVVAPFWRLGAQFGDLGAQGKCAVCHFVCRLFERLPIAALSPGLHALADIVRFPFDSEDRALKQTLMKSLAALIGGADASVMDGGDAAVLQVLRGALCELAGERDKRMERVQLLIARLTALL
jgi:hypothetical protein